MEYFFCYRSNPGSPFTIKTYNNVHTCGNQDENKVVTSSFLAKVFKDDFRFKELNDYYEELRRSNPGTTVKNEARQSYDPVILPIRALELWHKTAMPLPPKYKPQPGRPKKKRKIDPVVEKPD
nr:uncharacterized protein LOC109172155 [Ipomoea batatas]